MTRRMLAAMAGATLAFFLVYVFLFPVWGNHALWLAVIIYLFLRGLLQTMLFRLPSQGRS